MTLSTIKAVVDAIQDKMATITGIKSAPDYPTEQVSDFPFVTTYPGKLDNAHTNSPDQFNATWNVNVEFHLARKNLPSEVQTALEFSETMLNALFKCLKDGNVAHGGVEGDFTEMAWGDVQTIGYRFVVKKVKVQTPIT